MAEEVEGGVGVVDGFGIGMVDVFDLADLRRLLRLEM